MCGGKILIMVLGELAPKPKIDISIRSICELGYPTEANISPNERRYCLMEICLVCWTLDSRRPAQTQYAKIWSIGTGHRMSDIFNQTPIQEVNLFHLPQGVLSVQAREDYAMCAISWRKSQYLYSAML